MTKPIRGWVGAATVALVLVGCGGTPVKPSTGEHVDATGIAGRVRTALLKDTDVMGTAIQVEASGSSVHLSGFVRNEHERSRAEALARQVAGVENVRNDLQLLQTR